MVLLLGSFADFEYYNYICHQIFDNFDFLIDLDILNMKDLTCQYFSLVSYSEPELSVALLKYINKKKTNILL